MSSNVRVVLSQGETCVVKDIVHWEFTDNRLLVWGLRKKDKYSYDTKMMVVASFEPGTWTQVHLVE